MGNKVHKPIAVKAIPAMLRQIPKRTRACLARAVRFVRAHRRIVKFSAIGVGCAVAITIGAYFSMPVSAQFNVRKLAVNQPITVSFSHPVRSSVNYAVYPTTQGTWQKSKDLLGQVTGLTFRSAQPLRPGFTYHVALTSVHPVLGVVGSSKPHTLVIATQKLQSVVVTSPVTPALTTTEVTAAMPYTNNGVRKLRLTSTDATLASAVPTSTNKKQFVWRFAKPLAQGVTYHLALTDLNRPAGQQRLQTIVFTTISAPQVTAATTTDHLYPGQPITVTFAQAMPASTDDFTFGCKGTGKWQDTHTYSFMPDTLPPATACPYTLHKGVHDTEGGAVETDQAYSTSSPGAAYVTGSSPGGSHESLGETVSISFDQPVDHTSAQNAFSLSPAVTGSFAWSGNTLTFKPSALDYQTTYTIHVATGVAATYGLPSASAFTGSFTTLIQTLKLNVPGYKQQYTLSCEESSLRMALAYRGINVSDMDVLQAEGYNPQPRNTTTNTWQNPYETFVGNVSGKEDVTGWGAYGPPIAAAAQKFGGSATYVAGITPQQVSAAIHANNPVVVWGVMPNETPKLDSWNTDTGLVTVVANAHVRTVYGVVGNASNPIGFYIHDPIYGDLYWTTAQLQANMTANGQIGSQGVVVN